MNEIQLRPSDNLPDVADPYASAYPLAPAQSGGYAPEMPDAGEETIFTKVHRLLRGRYKWCILVGGVLGAGLGFAGYKSTRPIWSSTATIQVKSWVNNPLTSGSNLQPFDQLKETQIALFRTQRVVEIAMSSREWKALGRDNVSVEALTDFTNAIKHQSNAKSEIIAVSFEDADPAVAQTGIKALIQAYQDVYTAGMTADQNSGPGVLENLAREAREKLRLKRESLQRTASQLYNTEELGPLLASQLEIVQDYKRAIADAHRQLNNVDLDKGDDKDKDNPKTPRAKPEDMTAEQIAAAGDATMQDLLRQQRTLENEYELMSANPNHPRALDTKRRLDQATRHVAAWRKTWIEVAQKGPIEGVPLPRGMEGLSPAQIRANIISLEGQLKKAEDEARKIGSIKFELDELRRDIQTLEGPLANYEFKIISSQLDNERIKIISDGERARITKDSRKQLAAAGGLFGMMLGFGFIGFLGLLDRRFRSPDDARSTGKLALLGVLPNLPDDLGDPEQAAIAAHCVHQIRTLLQIGSGANHRRVFTITSPGPGTGKTSLSLSLGVSFAAAQSKTLLIDCDLIGGGLTVRVDAIIRRKIGQILARQGLVTQAQLDVAVRLARNSSKKFGEILVELGHITEAEIAKALATQIENPVGILDALAGEQLEECVAETGIEGLYILPLGAAMPNDVSKLSPQTIRPLLDRARQIYDTIIIDTGPVPGSLEASLVSGASDGVVMVVSRGEHRPLVEKAVQHMRDIGSPLIGMVFNRAENWDVDMASTTSRLSSFDRARTRATVEADVVPGTESEAPKFGPMARAVTGEYPAEEKDKTQ